MAEPRQPYTMLVFGMKGVGKTYATLNFELKNYIRKHGVQQARPVIILDVQGEFHQFKAINYDVHEPNRFKRGEVIRKIKKANIYRIRARHSNNMVFSKEEIMQACFDIAENFKNGLFLMEDLNRYMTSNIPDSFYAALISIRHMGLDLIMHYQKVGDPPPRITGNANFIRLHKINDSITKSSIAAKYTDPEVMRVAEIIVNKEYFKGNIHYFIYIDSLGSKLLNISDEIFEEAMRDYLYENPREVSLIMKRRDDNGNRLYKNENEAMRFIINQKKQLYLMPKPKVKITVSKHKSKFNKKK